MTITVMADPRTARIPLAAKGPLLTIDHTAIADNTRLFATRTSAEVMAVVKADGFGHGAATVARIALANGATSLGVTTLTEALTLRSAGIAAPVLSWLNPVDSDWATAVRRYVEVAVPSSEHLTAITAVASRTGLVARIHLHLDCGMARDGASAALWPQLCELARLAERRGLARVVGIMGHLGCADSAEDLDGRAAFDRGLDVARHVGLTPKVRHLAATSATLRDPYAHHDLVRIGAGLVGIDPTRTTTLRQPLTLTAPVVGVREVPAGTGVGYGHAHRTPRRTTLALLPVGYADGLPRVASNRAEVHLAGKRRPIVGRISMDQVVVDLGADTARPGEIATVFGPGHDGEPTVRDWADWSDTIEHEIVTGLGSRITRSHS